MATKKEDHTGFRNGDLFCFNCGRSQKLPLPMPMDLASEWMMAFAKVHKHCVKKWTEPVPEINEKTEQENADWWLENGEHGTSSETMFRYLDGRKIGKYQGHPSDPDDFKRCYKLLQAVPQWKSQLHKMKAVSPVWEKLVDNWDKLTEMYEQNEREEWKNYKKVGMYDFMKSLGC
jgi:hypothetical protein